METESKTFDKVRVLNIKGTTIVLTVGGYVVVWDVYHPSATRDILLVIGKGETPPQGDKVPPCTLKQDLPEHGSRTWLHHEDARKVVLLLATQEATAFWEVWSIATEMTWRAATTNVELYLNMRNYPLTRLLKGVLTHFGLSRASPDKVADVTKHVEVGVKLGLWEERWVKSFEKAKERATWRKILGNS